jgi:Bacterial Ig-like domain (group 2)
MPGSRCQARGGMARGLATAMAIAIGCGGTPTTPAAPAVATLMSVSVSGVQATLEVGQTSQLAVTGLYSDGSHKDLTGQSQFASSNPPVASVGPSGLLTAWSSGIATITAEPRNPAVQNFQPLSGAVAVAAGPPFSLNVIPTLLSPANSATLPNNCPHDPCNVIWTFTWSAVPGATAYHLNVIHAGASFAIIDVAEITDPSYQFNLSALGGGIASFNLQDWRWMVQAKVQGVYQAWSPFNSFDVLPMSPSTLAGASRARADGR